MVEWLPLLQQKERFLIIVKPKSRKTAVLGYDEEQDAFSVAVKAPPVEGKANHEIERYFSKLLGAPVRIKTGLTGKKKLLERL